MADEEGAQADRGADPEDAPVLGSSGQGEHSTGQAGAAEAEAATVEGAPFPPFQPRWLGQEGDVVPKVPAGRPAPAPTTGDEGRDEGRDEG